MNHQELLNTLFEIRGYTRQAIADKVGENVNNVIRRVNSADASFTVDKFYEYMKAFDCGIYLRPIKGSETGRTIVFEVNDEMTCSCALKAVLMLRETKIKELWTNMGCPGTYPPFSRRFHPDTNSRLNVFIETLNALQYEFVVKDKVRPKLKNEWILTVKE